MSWIAAVARRTLLAGCFAACAALPATAEETPKVIPAPAFDARSAAPSETAVLSGGCFWGMQGVFEHVKGVTRVLAGYSGGDAASAHYEIVATGTTGHAETVEIAFDPRQVSFGTLLRVYFSVAHDPTELNYQGPDEGTQYRSDIFYTSEAQKRVAEAYIRQLGAAHVFPAPIVTRLDRFRAFYPAEGYHQDYLIKNPDWPYIVINDLPKIAALKRLYPALYRETPVTVHAPS